MKQYFYEENGKVKRYNYCSLCGKGPYKEDKIVSDNVTPDKILYVAGQTANTKIYYCYTCNNYITMSSPKKEAKTFFVDDVKQTSIKDSIEEEELPKETIQSSSKIIVTNVNVNDVDYSDLLLKESKCQLLTPLTGEWSIILLKSKNGQFYCKSLNTDPVQFTNDYNDRKIKIQGVNVLPLELVYIRRTEKESDAKSIEDIIKKRPKLFKQNLIANYMRTVGGTK